MEIHAFSGLFGRVSVPFRFDFMASSRDHELDGWRRRSMRPGLRLRSLVAEVRHPLQQPGEVEGPETRLPQRGPKLRHG